MGFKLTPIQTELPALLLLQECCSIKSQCQQDSNLRSSQLGVPCLLPFLECSEQESAVTVTLLKGYQVASISIIY